MTLADAAKSAGSQRGGRGQDMPSGMPQMGGNMPEGMPNMPEGMEMPGSEAADGAQADMSIVDKAKRIAKKAVEAFRAWLYEGVEVQSAEQVTGSLVEVSVGMQNDDYAEITSGLSEGDIVLYTASEENSGFSMFGGMGGMGGMMGGRR